MQRLRPKMKTANRFRATAAWIAAIIPLLIADAATPALAETGLLRAVITRGGLFLGVAGGHGKLTFRGHDYPLTVTGLSVGAVVGASTIILTGHAHNLRAASDIEGTYNSVGIGGALIVGAARLRLQNANGVVLDLRGAKVGAELSAALGGVWVKLR
jgi:hypothetical protein